MSRSLYFADDGAVVLPGVATRARRSRSNDDPTRELRLAGTVIAAFLAVGIGWAAFAPLDSAVAAQGTVKVSGERRKLQTMDEGSISALHVAEGAHVSAGQLLVEFAATDARANERALASRVIGLQAEIAALQAENAGGAVKRPAAFSAYVGDDKVEGDRALASAALQLHARRAAGDAQRAVLAQRVVQVGDQLDGYRVRRSSTDMQRQLLRSELAGIQSLAAKGYASKNRVLEMQRNVADLDGSAGALESESARLRSAAGETRLQINQTRSDEMQATTTRLREAFTELQTLLPQWAGARAQVARTQVRAPVSGTVVGLQVHSTGVVTAPGMTLMDIVPDDRSLTIEARVPVTEVNQLHAGQAARLRMVALHGRDVPVLDGVVSRVSADSFVDERTGQSFYTMNVGVTAAELARLRRSKGQVGVLRPGNPVQVMVTLRPRSALSYWYEPLTQTLLSSAQQF